MAATALALELLQPQSHVLAMRRPDIAVDPGGPEGHPSGAFRLAMWLSQACWMVFGLGKSQSQMDDN